MENKKNAFAGLFVLLLIFTATILLSNLQLVRANPDPDLNDDGVINLRDISLAAKSFGARPGDDLWNTAYDLNEDEVINVEDLVMILCYYGYLQNGVSVSIDPDIIIRTAEPGESVTWTVEVTFTSPFSTFVGLSRLCVSEGYEDWITSIVPETHVNIWTNTDPYIYEVTLTVPPETVPGNYSFQITTCTLGYILDEEATENVTIEVIPSMVIPEVPLGPLLATFTMLVALLIYVTLQKSGKANKQNSLTTNL